MNVYLPYTRLPSEYQEVEYIESSGTQRIDTGVVVKGTIGFEIDFKGLDTISSTGHAIIGGRYRGGQQELALSTYYLYTGGLVAYDTSNADAKIVKDKRQQCSLKNGVFTDCDGGTTTFTLSSFTTTANLQIFAMRDVYLGTYSDYASVALYSLKLYDGTTLVRDFVPCYRKSDNVIGMYDLVNDQFYTNSGTGTFSKGNDVTMTELKNAYIGIPYPESISLDKNSISLTTIGQTEQLTATLTPDGFKDATITWTSSDNTIATVSSSGLVTCVTPGECTITATTVNNLTATCSVAYGWQPGANTVLYFPLTSDAVDTIAGVSLSNGGGAVSYVTPSGLNISCAHFSSAGYLYKNTATSQLPTGASPRTISGWIYFELASRSGVATYGNWGNNQMCSLYIYESSISNGWRFTQWGSGSSYGSTQPLNVWTNVILTYDGSNIVWYLNGVADRSWVHTISTSNSHLYLGADMSSQSGGVSGGLKGYLSQVIIEDKCWTAQEVADYYAQTKGNYGL